jgi:chitodextrinase
MRETPREESVMKKLIVGLLGWAATMTAQPAAQAGVDTIVYDSCYADLLSYEVVCTIYMADLEGSNTVTLAAGSDPAWSPDGSKIAFTERSDIFARSDICVLNLSNGSLSNLTNHPASNLSPVWSRDGAKIAFASDRDGPLELYRMNADGSGVTRLTFNVGFVGQPAWFPDAGRIAFDCQAEGGYSHICAINTDGTGLVRLTSDPGNDSGAAFSPDGRLAFATTRFGGDYQIATMDTDGTISQLGAGVLGWQPVWSPDGARLAYVDSTSVWYTGRCYIGAVAHNADDFCVLVYALSTINVDGTGRSPFGSGGNPDWRWAITPVPVLSPRAVFAYSCTGSTCSFDASLSSDSDGTITSYTWAFGDGTSGAGATVSHTYATGATYAVALTVVDNGGRTSTQTQNVNTNAPPIASFTFTCTGVTCDFNGSSSQDWDGTITSYVWNFGDGTTGSGPTPSHAYAAAGTYTITLTVTDNGGATGTQSQKTVVRAFLHVGDLDGTVTNNGATWTALVTITVHDSNHSPVAGATVSGSWSDGGTGSCPTSGSGQCAVSKSKISKSTRSGTFTVANVTHPTLTYNAPNNHDPDGDSNGTVITLSWP